MKLKRPKRRLWSRNLPGLLDMLGLREEMQLYEKMEYKVLSVHNHGYCFRGKDQKETQTNEDPWIVQAVEL
jgi:hypothetical protein